MTDDQFQRKLADIIGEIGSLPPSEQDKLKRLAQETTKRRRELKETVAGLQESIDFLRLSIKYILFDLEATRRENTQLRKMLDDQTDAP